LKSATGPKNAANVCTADAYGYGPTTFARDARP
jgi:hypothetical protein